MNGADHPDKPEVSVITPVFNSRPTLEEALASVAQQTFANWEAVVVDDGSADAPETVVDPWVRRDARFRTRRHDRNRGLAAARNTGIGAARGRWLLFLDADDLLKPNALADMVAVLRARTDVCGVYTGWTMRHANGARTDMRPAAEARVTFETVARRCPFQVPGVMVAAAAVARAGGFDESLRQCEDWDLWIRIYRCGFTLACVTAPLVVYRVQATGLSHRHFKQWQYHRRVIDMAHAPDPRCPGGLDRHAAGPGAASRDAALRAGTLVHLHHALGRLDEVGAIAIAAATLADGLPTPEADDLAHMLIHAMATHPDIKDNVLGEWRGFMRGLHRVAPLLAAAGGNRAYRRDLITGFVHLLAPDMLRREMVWCALRARGLLRPRRMAAILKHYVWRR